MNYTFFKHHVDERTFSHFEDFSMFCRFVFFSFAISDELLNELRNIRVYSHNCVFVVHRSMICTETFKNQHIFYALCYGVSLHALSSPSHVAPRSKGSQENQIRSFSLIHLFIHAANSCNILQMLEVVWMV